MAIGEETIRDFAECESGTLVDPKRIERWTRGEQANGAERFHEFERWLRGSAVA